MTSLSINTIEAKETFSDLINRVAQHHERIIITRRGKEIAALIPIEDLADLDALQAQCDLKEATEALKQARALGVISLDTFKSEMGNL